VQQYYPYSSEQPMSAKKLLQPQNNGQQSALYMRSRTLDLEFDHMDLDSGAALSESNLLELNRLTAGRKVA